MIRVFAPSFVLMLALAAACDPGNEPAGGTSTSDTEAATIGPDCIEGEIDCPCDNGSLCEQGLVCTNGTCRDPAADDTGASGGVDGSTTSPGDGGVDECSGNEECDVSEICVFSTCTPSDQYAWEVAVTYFEPGGCRDGWGTAELFYRYSDDTGVVYESSTQGCPASWPDDWFTHYPPDGFRLDFLELDAFFDDDITAVCWTDDLGQCGPLPPEVLHDGGYFGYSGDGLHYFELLVLPILE